MYTDHDMLICGGSMLICDQPMIDQQIASEVVRDLVDSCCNINHGFLQQSDNVSDQSSGSLHHYRRSSSGRRVAGVVMLNRETSNGSNIAFAGTGYQETRKNHNDENDIDDRDMQAGLELSQIDPDVIIIYYNRNRFNGDTLKFSFEKRNRAQEKQYLNHLSTHQDDTLVAMTNVKPHDTIAISDNDRSFAATDEKMQCSTESTSNAPLACLEDEVI